MKKLSPETDYAPTAQNAAGHTLRNDFFQFHEREAEQIQSHLDNDVYANFTLDGKGTLFTPFWTSFTFASNFLVKNGKRMLSLWRGVSFDRRNEKSSAAM